MVRKLAALALLPFFVAGCSGSPDGRAGGAGAGAPSPAPSVDTDRVACHAVSSVDGFLGELDPAKSRPAAETAMKAEDRVVAARAVLVLDAIDVVESAADPRGEPNADLMRAWIDLADACGDLYGDGPW